MGLGQLLALVRMRLGSVPEGCWHGSRVPLVVTTLKAESARERARAPGHLVALEEHGLGLFAVFLRFPAGRGLGIPLMGLLILALLFAGPDSCPLPLLLPRHSWQTSGVGKVPAGFVCPQQLGMQLLLLTRE